MSDDDEFELLRRGMDFSDGHCQIYLVGTNVPGIAGRLRDELREQVAHFENIAPDTDSQVLFQRLKTRGKECPDALEALCIDLRKGVAPEPQRNATMLALQYGRNHYYAERNNLALIVLLDPDGFPELNAKIPDFFSVRSGSIRVLEEPAANPAPPRVTKPAP